MTTIMDYHDDELTPGETGISDEGGLVLVTKLSREVRKLAEGLSRPEARGYVDLYYRVQHNRIELNNQTRALTADDRPTDLSRHFGGQFATVERQMVSVLDAYSLSTVPGVWSRAQHGIGPVIAAGFQAHLDIERAPTVGHFWRFAGLDPTVKWGKGQKRPWNADLKTLCWKLGDSFRKFSNAEACFYGHLYRQRKAYELERDEGGGNADTATQTLAERNFRDADTKALYESGHLPAGRLDLRASRWAVKLFLAHLHEVMYVDRYDSLPPKPYAMEHLGHAHEIVAPHLPEQVRALRRAVGR
jgi:hypothetical protein